MSLDRGLPGRHPLARPVIFGAPFHGLVQGGSLTLPNTEVKPYPQPNTTDPDMAGATFLVQRSGVPEVSRTPEQIEADTAAGYQWRNMAMLSGGLQQIFGQDLGGWLYIDPAGRRWWIQITTDLINTAFAFVSSLSLSFSVRSFGEFGVAATGFTETLTLSDWGQSGYLALTDFDSEFSFLTTAHLVLDGVVKDGAKAAFCVHRRRLTSSTAGDETVDVAVRHPLGWLEVSVETVGGLPVLTLNVLKSREEVLEVVSNSRDPYPPEVTYPALLPLGPAIKARFGTYGFEFEGLRLVGLWADPLTSEWRWLALRIRHAGMVSTSVDVEGSAYVQTAEVSFEHWIAIELDGAEQMRVATDRGSRFTSAATYAPDGGGASLTLSQIEGEIDVTIDGSAFNQTFGPIEQVVYPYPSVTEVAWSPQVNPGDVYDEPESAVLTMVFKTMWRQALQGVLTPPDPYQVKVDVCRQSPQVFTLRMHLLSGTVSNFVYWPRLTPGGLSGGKVTRAYAASERLYGSWCPHTGQVASMQSAPVCWV